MSSRWISYAVAALVASGCNNSAPNDTASATDDPQPGAKQSDPGPAPSADPEPDDDETVKEHMADHFGAVRSIQVAIAHGNLDRAKERAAYLAEHPTHEVLEHWEPYVDMVRLRARTLTAANDLEAAAVHASKLGLACSRCHLDLTAIATFSWQEPPGDETDARTHMQRHQWAIDRMWEGLVAPSNILWSTGSEVLTEAALHAHDLDTKAEAPPQQVAELAKVVHELGARALETEAHDERAAIYGQLLGTCSRCHGLARK